MMDRKKTILVIDDVPEDILILEEILKGDYQVKAVTNGEAALALVRKEPPPDLILLDVMMPGMDGFEVCRRLKEDSERATIPVIFLTAKVMSSDEKIGLELGAVDYIRKPVEPDIVKARIRLYLEGKDLALRLSEIRYRRLFETANDGIMIVDVRTGALIDVNPALASLFGLSLEAFLGKRVTDIDFLNVITAKRGLVLEGEGRKYVRYRDVPVETADGRTIFIEFTSSAYQVNRRDVMQINIRDITGLVEAERERDALAVKLSHYLSTSPTVTYSLAIKDGAARWQWISENVVSLLGYTSGEALSPGWWFDNVSSGDRAAALDIITELAKEETASREYRFSKKDRSVVWLHDEMRILRGPRGESEIVGTLTNVTERKAAEEELHLKGAALEAAANAVVITDRAGIIRWANPAFGALTGYSIAEAVGHRPQALVKSGVQDEAFYSTLWDTVRAGKVWSGTLVNRKKSGELYTEEMTITPVLDASGAVGNFVAVKNDITVRERSRVSLESALREKDTLLREIHHRVNNSMQVIISLLNLSAQGIDDEGLRGKIDDVKRRIHAMAIVYEQFYEADDMSRIDFAVFIRKLVLDAKREFPVTARHALVDCQAGSARLQLEQAIPAALIVAELFTNAVKFAFPGGREPGAITVTQRITEGSMLEIEVRDDGVGLPPGIEPGTANSMGMTLVRILSEQLGGRVDYGSGAGTAAALRFPIANSHA